MLVPLLVTIALGVASMVASHRFWTVELDETLRTSPVVGWIFRSVMTALGGAVLFLVAQPLLLAVFVDRLSERVEKNVRGSVPAVPFLASIGWALVHGLLKLVLYGIALVAGGLLTVATGGVGSLVGVALAALFLAYDGFDYPLARRNVSFGGKWAYLLRHPALTIGYGAGATLLYLIPLAIFVAPPFAGVGATLAFMEDEDRKKPAKSPGNVAANT